MVLNDPNVFSNDESSSLMQSFDDVFQIEQPAVPLLSPAEYFSQHVHSTNGQNEVVFNHPDPLSQIGKYSIPTCNLHTVDPHYVKPYVKADGTL